MLLDIFKTVLLLSVSGTIIIIALSLLKPFTEHRLGTVWQYYIWLAAIAVLLFPLRTSIPYTLPHDTSEKLIHAIQVIERVQIKNISFVQTKSAAPQFSVSPAQIAAVLWLVVAAFLLLYKCICYVIFKNQVCKASVYKDKCGRVNIRTSEDFSSPLLMGVLKPVLIIPDGILENELDHVLKHELMHHKRCDVVYKWLTAFIKCVHWFNPFVYFLTREIDNECEISCDFLLTRDMNSEEKKSYMKTVLSLIERKSVKKAVPFASMASNKHIIKKRFKMITVSKTEKLHVHITATMASLAVCLAGVLVSTCVFSLPALAVNTPLGEGLRKVFNKGTVAAVSETNNRIEEISVPTYEGAVDSEELPITEALTSPSDTEAQAEPFMSGIKKNTASDEPFVGMEILEFSEKRSTTEMTSLIEGLGISHINGEFNFEEGCQKFITGIQPDSNGNITMFLSSDTEEIIQVDLWEMSSAKDVWGVHVPSNGKCAYSFSGFDKNKLYGIRLYSPAKESWKIDSEYIIY